MFQPTRLHLDSSSVFIKEIQCGDLHTMLLSGDGQALAFGDNSEGQLGISCEYKQVVDRPVMLRNFGEEVIQLACGFRHSLILTESGKVFGMGANKGHEMG
jgi:alpha-tubulin suppressor-like RCC1 family protein